MTKISHEWRICPVGEHYVREHKLHVPPSKEYPHGRIVTRRAHCAKNISSRDVMSYAELLLIAQSHFSDLDGPPVSKRLKKFPNADEFDVDIRGWTKYWNEVFNGEDPLDPNLVKALIASESSFKVDQRTPTRDPKVFACGLMQITTETAHIMSNHRGELKDQLIVLNNEELFNHSANICAGVRWLFRKKVTAAKRLKHAASWDDAVAEYKGILKGIIENKNPDPLNEMKIFRGFYQELKSGVEEQSCTPSYAMC